MWEKMTTEKNSKVVGSVIMERKMEQLLLPLLSLCVCVCFLFFVFFFFCQEEVTFLTRELRKSEL